MPDWCISMRCLDCEHHAVVGGKIDCNYMNRLGLAQPKVQTFMVDETDPAKLDAMMKDMEEQEKHIKEQMEKIAELKKLSAVSGVGGDSSG